MNLSDCKTIEEYREAAHYWQKKWDTNNKALKECLESLATVSHLFDRASLRVVTKGTKIICDNKEMTIQEMINWTIKQVPKDCQ